ncbi:hypothetical protein EJ104_01975 [Deinococcus radiophilus]|uniref:Uncharacterized protein n=1 Tax=Deinococcus radiophilus TaxID=32062 RepID=A0A431W4K2_9DEIO|nr:hypothetical protein EJ104_01975 [Deinococcus radiophilus]
MPPPTRSRWTGPLLGVTLLSLLPALWLAYERVRYEESHKAVAVVMDYPELKSQADRYGRDPLELLADYRELGVNGVAVYEDVLGGWQNRGEVFVKSGADLLAQYPGEAFAPGKFYLSEVRPGALAALEGRFSIQPRSVTLAGREWQEWNINPAYLPVGPDNALIDTLKSQGYTVIYRPYDNEALLNVGADWPEVPFIAFNGTEVPGARDPQRLEQVNAALGDRLPALIEATPQRGLGTLMEGRGAVRMFSLNAQWQQNLRPEETASKYALAARERTHRLLYVRPYPTITETETFLGRTSELLGRAGITLAQPRVDAFAPNTALRWLTMLGPLAALLLIGLSYPLPRLGLLVAGLALLGALGLNRFEPFGGMALVASIAFPALGFVLWRSRVTHWFTATALSLAGVLFVSALGANPQSMLGLEPFRGVGLTLIAPLALVLGSYLPRQDLRQTAADLYRRPISMGDIVVMGLALVAFAVMFLRRGNTSAVGVSDAEARIRQEVQDSIIRPRFKEVLGHPLALLGLSGGLPGYFPGLLLLGGVMGQASILNTFAHFHTPLLISATRMFIGLGVGLALGYALIFALRWGLQLWETHGGGLPERSGRSEVRS